MGFNSGFKGLKVCILWVSLTVVMLQLLRVILVHMREYGKPFIAESWVVKRCHHFA